MSANNILCLPQHKAVLVASDTAVYTRDGIIVDFRSKIWPVDHWPGIVTGRGTAIAAQLLAPALADLFSTFDDLVAGIEKALPLMVAETGVALEYEMLIAGWSKARQAPECYMIQTAEMTLADNTADEIDAARQSGFILPPYTLSQMPAQISGPPLRTDATIDVSFDGFPVDGPLEDIARVLHLTIEAQRQQPDRNGFYWVGGEAELASVTPAGVEMSVLEEWEDEIGELVKPAPIDWTEFRVSIGLAPGFSVEKRAEMKAYMADLDRRIEAQKQQASAPLAGMSRLQRQRMEKKARKGTLRSV